MLAQIDVVATTTGRSSSADAGAEASASGAPSATRRGQQPGRTANNIEKHS